MLKMYINGEWKDAISNNTYKSLNPATGEVVSEVAYGDARDAAEAIESAANAFKDWAALTAKERANFLVKLYNLILEEKEEFARLITLEMGKPIKEARGEVELAAEYVLWFAEEARRVNGEIIPASSKARRIHIIKQPVGPIAAITPWNFPVSMLTRKIAPALAAGCTVVLKPASSTPSSAVKLFECIDRINFPKGVANLVIGKASSIGEEFTSNKKVKKITFTGSTEIGKGIMEKAGKTIKRISLELGGNAPFIVFNDADLEKAAEGVILSKYRNTGQTCICMNRLYVHSSVKNQFESILKEKVARLKMGNGLEETTEIGPLVDQGALEKVKRHVDDALSKGAKLILGGKANGTDCLFYEPTILSNVTENMLITHEETFGPVCPIYEFNDEDEVIKAANNTDYGLAAYFYTRDLGRATRVGERLEFGIIGINDAVPATVQAPFGGMKESGMGREGGHQGIEGFLEEKFLSITID